MSNPVARFFNRLTTYGRSSASTIVTTRTAAGVRVSSGEGALESDAIYAGIRYLAQTVGQLPWYAYKPKAAGKGADVLQTAQFAGVNGILNGRCNSSMSSQRFREVMLTYAILYGNAVAEIERDTPGRAAALYILNPERLKIHSPNGADIEFEYQDERRGRVILGQDQVFHIANFGALTDAAPIGKSVIEYAAQSLGWARATELFGAAYFANGIHPIGLLVMKNSLSPEAYKVFQEELRRKFSGARGQFEPFVTDGEATYTKLSVQPEEAQFVGTMQHQVEQAARWIGVPPSKLHHLLHAGVRANVEHASIEVVIDSIQPWARRFELEADAKLFRQNERYYTRMDMEELLRGDMAARADFYTKMLVNGVYSVNMVLEKLDENPIGPEGDQHLVQGQYMPLADVGRFDRTDTGAIGAPKTLEPVPASAPAAQPKQITYLPQAESEEEEWGGVVRTIAKSADPKLDDVLSRLAERLA